MTHSPSYPTLLAAAALALLSLPLGGQAPPTPAAPTLPPMTINRIEPMPAPGEPLYARVVLAAAPPQANFQFTVDGHAAPFERLAATPDDAPAFQLLVGGPGHKLVTVLAQSGNLTLQASRPFDFATNGGILLFGYYDQQPVANGEELQLLTYFARNPLLRVNGQPVPIDAEPGADPQGFAFYLCRLPLRPGANLLQYAATTLDGRRSEKTLTLYSFDNHQAHVGDRFRFLFGSPTPGDTGQKTSLRIAGQALQSSGPAEPATILTLSDYSFLATQTLLVQPIAALQPGAAQITILGQTADGVEELETLPVTVLP